MKSRKRWARPTRKSSSPWARRSCSNRSQSESCRSTERSLVACCLRSCREGRDFPTPGCLAFLFRRTAALRLCHTEYSIDDMPQEILSLPPPPADLRIPYGAEKNQFIDFRFPVCNTAVALVVMIHGGFWRQRYDLTHAGHLCAAVTASGLTTANIEYRRIGEPGGGWPGTFDDIQAALQRAQRRHGNNKPALVVGHSAGGHLGLWVATRDQDLAAIIALAPVSCLRTAWRRRLGDGAVADLLGGSPDDVPDRYLFGCPSQQSTRVPRILIHGTGDDIVPLDLSREYLTARTVESDMVRLIELPGADHFDLIDPRSASWRTVLTEIKNAANASS